MVAAVSSGTSFYTKSPIKRQLPERGCSQRGVVLVRCLHSREPINGTRATTKGEDPKEEKKTMSFDVSLGGFEKLGKCLRENLSPKQKGDWKDLTLMSLSFAVYVYISQKLVCAYFAWIMSMPKQLW
ncbi:uncharacterized protein LOC133829668 [Humulus lupulus]|uniref:uncharacterized protein LOC133829668 n=1 Tax=Humulus lupulus TaxID=3486 RepID=UPI002B40522B|nr:uncharacterized protein LOC133829668 [Humulus lupulus]